MITKKNRRNRYFITILRIGGLLLLWLISSSSSPSQVQATPTTGEGLALEMFLNTDGTLNLPAEDILGSIDPAGYQLVSAPGEAPRFAPISAAPTFVTDDANWDPRFLASGINNAILDLAWDGSNLYAGGNIATAGGVAASRIAQWDGATWSPLGSGVDSSVLALVSDGSNLYVGGHFTTAGGVAAIRIAQWDGATWSPLGSGMNSSVRALAWDGSNLYAGGFFTTAGGVAAARIAQWDGANWSPLGSGMNKAVWALAWDEDSLYNSLYVGGEHTTAGTKSSNYIARWRYAAIWDGGGGDNNGSTAANWSGDAVPLTTDVAIFDSTSSKDGILDASFPNSLLGLVIEESYDGTVTHNQDMALASDFDVYGGTMILANPTVNSFTVGGTVTHEGGTLQQTRPVNASSNVAFLEIDDGAATVKYRGMEISTVGSGANLGSTTTAVRAIEGSVGEYCTIDGATSPDYTKQCYEITPTTDGAARVRLWAPTSRLNGIAEGALAVYHYEGSSPWTELMTNAANGNDGGSFSYAEGETTGFSPFLLGETGQAPTAVSLQNISTHRSPPMFLISILLLLIGGTLVMYRINLIVYPVSL